MKEESKEEILLRRIEELELKVNNLEGEIRFLKSKDQQVKGSNYYPFWHESQNTPSKNNPAVSHTGRIVMDLHNNMESYYKKDGE